MEERYDSKAVEERLRGFWDHERVYAFDSASKKRIYSIDTPPPTISGYIGIHHVFSYSHADFIARYKRMRGFSVFYPMGYDNNGLPTELLTEKNHNTTAEREGREKFVRLVEEETRRYEQEFGKVWRSIGISVDWSLLYTTISSEVQRVSQLSFLELNRMGRVYRKKTPTIWCTKERTALSQMELKDKELSSKFVDIRFAEEVVIATTRPEMLPACAAIFVNPDDEKNRKLVGRRVKVPIFGQEVEIRTDSRVDPSKGTGVVMCCTFGDLTDIEWYKAYGLELRTVIDDSGRMLGEYFKGMKIRDARSKIIEDLRQKGYLVSEREVVHAVNVHERCGTEIEFLVKEQWYIRYLDLKGKFIELGNGLAWHPEHMHVRYDNWVNGLQWDWSISRQRYYGVPFPVWYCRRCGDPVFAEEKDLPVNPLKGSAGYRCAKCGSDELVPEEDVLDTWATSSLTPLINAGWKGGDAYSEERYPMSLRPQAHDIISFWLFTSVVKGYMHTKKAPWSTVMISGHALDPHGKPMHKSAGNLIDPQPLMERYGADAVRYWASLSKPGDDASFQEKDVITGARLVNKLWNVAKLVEKVSEKGAARNTANVLDRWIVSKAELMARDATVLLEDYNYAGARRLVDGFFWSFCDNYLEFIKYRFYSNDRSASYALRRTFLIIIKLLAPFMPYVTEEVYQHLYRGVEEKTASVHLAAWPEYDDALVDAKAVETGEKVQGVVGAIRPWKHRNGLALNGEVSELVIEGALDDGIEDIKGAMRIRKVSAGKGETDVPETGLRITVVK